MANDSTLYAIGKGSLNLLLGNQEVLIKDVYLLPNLVYNILSLKPFYDHRIPFLFDEGGAFVLSRSKNEPQTILEDTVRIGDWDTEKYAYFLYGIPILDNLGDRKTNGHISVIQDGTNLLDSQPEPRYATLYDFLNMKDLTDFEKDGLLHYHKKFGHASWTNLQKLIQQGVFTYKPTQQEIDSVMDCVSCKIATSTKASHKQVHERSKRRLERVHSDTMGPFVVRMEKFYATTLIDDYSGYTELIWTKSKSVAQELLTVMQHWNTKFPEKISYFRADNAKELPSVSQLSKLGIRRDDIASYTPQLNGLSERTNRTILQYVRKAVQTLPARSIDLLPYLFKYAVHIKNLLPTARNDDSTSPYTRFFEKPVNPARAQPFGLDVIVDFSNDQEARVNNKKLPKPEKNAVFGTLVGFGTDSNNYQILLSLPGYRVITTSNVTFLNSFKVIVYYLAFINSFTFMDAQDNHKKLEELYERANTLQTTSILSPFDDLAFLGTDPDIAPVQQPQNDVNVPNNIAAENPSYSTEKIHHDVRDDIVNDSPPEDISLPEPISESIPRETTDAPAAHRITPDEVSDKSDSPSHQQGDDDLPTVLATESVNAEHKNDPTDPRISTSPPPEEIIADPKVNDEHALQDIDSRLTDSPKIMRKRQLDDPPPGDERPRVSDPSLTQGDDGEPENQYVRRSARLSEKRLRINAIIIDNRKVDLNKPEWQAAIKREYDSFVKLDVFEEVEIPSNKKDFKLIPMKWVCSLKINDQKENLYKTRCVVQGFRQREDIDYDSNLISSPVVRYKSVRYLMAVAVEMKWTIHHLDICTAYLNANLSELTPTYVKPPPGIKIDKGKCWKLKKAVYGMKQAGYEWYQCLTNVLTKMGFVPNPFAAGIFTLNSGDDPKEQLIIALYVDDLFMASSSSQRIKTFKDELKSHFDLKYFGEVADFYGTQFKKTESGYIANQHDYVKEVDKLVPLEQNYTRSLPLSKSERFTNSRGKNGKDLIDEPKIEVPTSPLCLEEQITHYKKVVGSLLWLATITRPDLSYSTNFLSLKGQSPTEDDLKTLEEPIRYLKRFPSLSLHFKRNRIDHEANTFKIETYVDASFANRETGRRSVTGFAIFVNRNLVDWRTKRQTSVTTSTNSAEIVALREAVDATLILRFFLERLGLKVTDAIIHEDNEATIHQCHNSRIFYERPHVDTALNYIREQIKNGLLTVVHVKSKDNIADMFTKLVSIKEFEEHKTHLLEEA